MFKVLIIALLFILRVSPRRASQAQPLVLHRDGVFAVFKRTKLFLCQALPSSTTRHPTKRHVSHTRGCGRALPPLACFTLAIMAGMGACPLQDEESGGCNIATASEGALTPFIIS